MNKHYTIIDGDPKEKQQQRQKQSTLLTSSDMGFESMETSRGEHRE